MPCYQCLLLRPSKSLSIRYDSFRFDTTYTFFFSNQQPHPSVDCHERTKRNHSSINNKLIWVLVFIQFCTHIIGIVFSSQQDQEQFCPSKRSCPIMRIAGRHNYREWGLRGTQNRRVQAVKSDDWA